MDFSDEQLIKAWKELPEKERLMLYLIDVEQLSLENVAAIARRPAEIVKERTDWARAALKRNVRFLSRAGDSHPLEIRETGAFKQTAHGR
jgi:DNA-directed RNA polymerase specialized sigma24 family protein